MTARIHVPHLLGGAIVLLALAGAVPAAFAQSSWERPVNCTRFAQVGPGLHVQREASTAVTGGIAAMPDRVFTHVRPGGHGRACIGFHNRTGRKLTFAFTAEDVGAARSGIPVTTAADDAPFGAAAWLRLPPGGEATLRHGDIMWLDVGIDVPRDARGGSSYAAVVATVVDGAPDGEAQARLTPSLAVQLFLDVEGNLDRSGELRHVRSPRVVWWDGLGIGDVPVLDRLRGPGIAPIRFQWDNTGSVTEQVSGRVVIRSSLGGRHVARMPVGAQQVLRGSRRSFDVTWQRGVPMVGRFVPTIRLTMADGRTVTRTLPSIWVIPAWWYLLLVLCAAGIPLWLRRRSRRRLADLREQLEMAQRQVATLEEEW